LNFCTAASAASSKPCPAAPNTVACTTRPFLVDDELESHRPGQPGARRLRRIVGLDPLDQLGRHELLRACHRRYQAERETEATHARQMVDRRSRVSNRSVF